MEVELLVKPRKPDPRVTELAARFAGKAGFLVERLDGGFLVAWMGRSAVLKDGHAEGEAVLSLSLSMLILSSAAALAMKRFMRRVKLGYRRAGAHLESWATGVDGEGRSMRVEPVSARVVRVTYTVNSHLYSLQAGLEALGYAAIEPPKVPAKG